MPVTQPGKAPLERTIAREIRNLALTCTFVTSYLGLSRERIGVAGRGLPMRLPALLIYFPCI
jgi:hypothetical protein